MPGSFFFKPVEASLADNETSSSNTTLYCIILTLGQSLRSKTSTSKGKQYCWDDTIQIVVRDQTKCLVEIRNKNRGILDDPIGVFEVDLPEIVKSQEKFRKCYEFGIKQAITGKMLLEAWFEPSEKGDYGHKLLQNLQKTIKQGLTQGGLFSSIRFIGEGKDKEDIKFEINFKKDKAFIDQKEIIEDLTEVNTKDGIKEDMIKDNLGNHLSAYCYEHNKVRVIESYPLSLEEQHWLVNGKDLLRGWGEENAGVSSRGGVTNSCMEGK